LKEIVRNPKNVVLAAGLGVVSAYSKNIFDFWPSYNSTNTSTTATTATSSSTMTTQT